MKKAKEFNEKYSDYLEDRFYGMAIDIPEVIEYMDKEFDKEIKVNPKFKYQQIKLKFNYPCVYTNSDKNREWESGIKNLIK